MSKTTAFAAMSTLVATMALAQTPAPAPAPPPPPPWTGNVAAGIAITSGNTDTRTFNLSAALASNPKARHAFAADAVYLRGSNEGDTNVNRTAVSARHQFALSPRAYLFEQVQYFRDPFKGLRYLLSPTVGAGYKVYESPETLFTVDGGLGLAIEGRPVDERSTDGAISANQKLSHKLNDATQITQSVAALWKLDAPEDALYTFGVSLATALTTRSQFKVELVDVYKTRPPSAAFGKNDLALITGIVIKY